MGVLWSLLQGLSVGVVAALALQQFLTVPGAADDYLLIVLVGTVVWTAFARIVAAGVVSIVEEQALLIRVWFPREVIPLSGELVAGAVDCVVAFVVVAAIVVATRPRAPHCVGWHSRCLLCW